MKTQQNLNIDQVWEQYHKTHDDKSRNLLMENYKHIVVYTAERLTPSCPTKSNSTT